jgi:hypothetical protein
MSQKKWIVELSPKERDELNGKINKGRTAAKTILKARILLKADEGALGAGWSDKRIVEALETNHTMVERVRKKLVEEGLEAVFTRKKRRDPPCKPIFDGEAEARLIALSCSKPPEGHAKWSIRLLAEKVVELEIVETVHHNTIGRTLKKIS